MSPESCDHPGAPRSHQRVRLAHRSLEAEVGMARQAARTPVARDVPRKAWLPAKPSPWPLRRADVGPLLAAVADSSRWRGPRGRRWLRATGPPERRCAARDRRLWPWRDQGLNPLPCPARNAQPACRVDRPVAVRAPVPWAPRCLCALWSLRAQLPPSDASFLRPGPSAAPAPTPRDPAWSESPWANSPLGALARAAREGKARAGPA